MEHSKALQIATKLLEELKPHCERIEIAGSIRRKKAEVKDIEIVCIPKTTNQHDLFANDTGKVPTPGFVETVGKWEKIKGSPMGRYTQRKIVDGENTINLDLFIVNADNWGLQFAIRTGSSNYSAAILAKGWSNKGFKSENGILYKGNKPFYIREEIDLFNLLEIPFVAPEKRNL